MKKILTLLFSFFILCTSHGQMVITEIMYNPPESGTDSLEYIELYNNSGGAIDLTGYSFSEGVDFTFPPFIIEGEGYVIIAVDTLALERTLGISEAFQFEGGALSNGGEDIVLNDGQGNMVDIVDYDNGGDWPLDANGEGASLELCDPNRDNNDASNWKASKSAKGVVINGREINGTPNSENNVSCADHTVFVYSNFYDPDTLIINLGETVEWICTEGRHNVNGSQATYPDNPVGFRSGPAEDAPWVYTFTFDQEGSYDYRCDPHFLLGMTGHVIVENNIPPALVITEIMYNDPGGDSLEFVEIYNNGDEAIDMNGFRLINAVSHEFVDVTLDPDTYLVVAMDKTSVDDAFGINSIQWDNGQLNNSGEAIEIIDNGGNSIDRVEYDSGGQWDSRANGTGRSLILCDVDADNSLPAQWSVSNNSTGVRVNGEEILANPGASDECEDVAEEYPMRDIGSITTVDIGGLPDSIGIRCAIQGIVHGIDLQGGNSIQFTLIDQTGGVGVFSSESFNYTVTEGDELLLKGVVEQFSGLTQLAPDSLRVVSTGNNLFTPRSITDLDESTESELIVIDAELTLVDPGEWDASGSSFNVLVTDGTNQYDMRIDDDTNIAGTPAPTDPFRLFGIGGQFDSSDPYTSGYQILPRYLDDLDFSVSVDDSKVPSISVQPNPATGQVVIEHNLDDAVILLKDMSGRTVETSYEKVIDVSSYSQGIYLLEVRTGKGRYFEKLIKQ